MNKIKLVLTFLCLMGLMGGPSWAFASEAKSIIKIGRDVVIDEGAKAHYVITIGGQITVSGTVEKSVIAIGGSVVLTKTAVVEGGVTALGGVLVSARDAQIGGSMVEINSSNLHEILTTALSTDWEGWSWIFAAISLSIFFVILVLALLIVALLPKPVHIVAEAISENTFKVFLWGLLGLVLIAPLAILLTISVVGIALIPLEVIVVVCSVLLGFIAVGQLIGRHILHAIGRPSKSPLRETFWGLIVLWLIGWIPYIGWMVKSVAIVIALGAALVTRFGTHQGWKCAPLPPSPVPVDDAGGGGASPPSESRGANAA